MTAAQTIVIQSSRVDPATLILASLGVVLALAALLWQAWSFLAMGSRVSVEVRVGLRGIGAVATLPNDAPADEVDFIRSQGFTDPVIAVKVNNSGRGATSIASVDLLVDDGGSIGDAVLDPPLPFRLVGESEETWYFNARPAFGYVKVMENIQPTGKPRLARGRAQLGSKKVTLSKNHIPIPAESEATR